MVGLLIAFVAAKRQLPRLRHYPSGTKKPRVPSLDLSSQCTSALC